VRSDSHLLSLDGDGTIVRLAPSGAIVGLLLQGNYVDAIGTQVIPFAFGEVEIDNDGDRITLFLRTTTVPEVADQSGWAASVWAARIRTT
jgi:hypothetical protein